MKFLLHAVLLLGLFSTPTVAQQINIGDQLELTFDIASELGSAEFFFTTVDTMESFELIVSNIYEEAGDGTISYELALSDLDWDLQYDQAQTGGDLTFQFIGTNTDVSPRFNTITIDSVLSSSSLKFDVVIDGYDAGIAGSDLKIDCMFKCDETADNPGPCEALDLTNDLEVVIGGTTVFFSIVSGAEGDTDGDGTKDEDVTVSLEADGNDLTLTYSGFMGGTLTHDPTFGKRKSGGGVCFAPDATAVVQGKGKTAMKDIAVGDMVLTGSGQYSSVYTIDHHHATRLTKYLQIDTSMEGENPLEVTPSHMVFIQGDSNPVPASNIKVGDAVKTLDGYQDVVEIKTVFRNGLYNPITPDGTIVADGVVASTYHAFSAHDKNVIIGEWKTPISHQTFMHMALAPFRTFCMGVSSSLCETEEEYNVYSKFGTHLLEFSLKQNIYVQGLLFLCILLLVGFMSCAPTLVGIYCFYKFSSKMIKS